MRQHSRKTQTDIRRTSDKTESNTRQIKIKTEAENRKVSKTKNHQEPNKFKHENTVNYKARIVKRLSLCHRLMSLLFPADSRKTVTWFQLNRFSNNLLEFLRTDLIYSSDAKVSASF